MHFIKNVPKNTNAIRVMVDVRPQNVIFYFLTIRLIYLSN